MYDILSSHLLKFEGSNPKLHCVFDQVNSHKVLKNAPLKKIIFNPIKKGDSFITKQLEIVENNNLYEYNEKSSCLPNKIASTNRLYGSNYKFIESVEKNCENIRQLDTPRKLHMNQQVTFNTQTTLDTEKNSQKLEDNKCVII